MSLSSLDAEFLDGMLALHEQARNLATNYVNASDVASSPRVVDMARGTLEQLGYADQLFREVRGFADGDELRRTEHVESVEVVSAY